MAITAQSSGGARLCSGPASCSLRQYSVRVCRGMPAARQLPMAIASRPSCSARRAAGAARSRSASGSSPLIAATYACPSTLQVNFRVKGFGKCIASTHRSRSASSSNPLMAATYACVRARVEAILLL